MSRKKGNEDQFSPKEAQSRFDAALRGAIKTPHKPLKPAKAPVKKTRVKKVPPK